MSAIQWSPAAWGGEAARPAVLARSFSIAKPPAPLVNRILVPTPKPTRTRLWEISAWMHCSIVGTCLATADLRHLLVRLGLAAPDVSDHAAHKIGVTTNQVQHGCRASSIPDAGDFVRRGLRLFRQ